MTRKYEKIGGQEICEKKIYFPVVIAFSVIDLITSKITYSLEQLIQVAEKEKRDSANSKEYEER